jgi:hypothetical protein
MTFQNTQNEFNIALTQNKSINLEKLSAQNYLYTCAKKYKAFQFILSVVVIILITFLKFVIKVVQNHYSLI